MKKTYINPSIVEVALQQQGLLCQSIQRVSSNSTVNYAGSDEGYSGKDCPLKRSNFSEQKHGAVVQVTKKELEKLIKHWEGK